MIARRLLLDWYRPRRRAFPWRAVPEPYSVLVAELMLQQTQVARVVPAHARFLRRFPSVHALASASSGEVIRAWAGLGYNRRAVSLWKAARAVVERFGGRIPADPAELELLPGIGPYTAAAVASEAYGVPVAALDTNVRRVVARAILGSEPGDVPVAELRSAAAAWLDPRDPGAWNQALMDLGREACRPLPLCTVCPLRSCCARPAAGHELSPPRVRGAVERFEGSFRQVRGRVVAALREQPEVSVSELAALVGEPVERVQLAVEALTREGIAAADLAALPGTRRAGSHSLPE